MPLPPLEESRSAYVLQVADRLTGEIVAAWAPGMAAERQLVEELVNRIGQKSVGVFRTRAQVQAAVGEALRELLHDLKAQV